MKKDNSVCTIVYGNDTGKLNFTYVELKDLFKVLSRIENVVEVNLYSSKKDASLRENFALAVNYNKFYVLRTYANKFNGIFFDKREAIQHKNAHKDKEPIIREEPNVKAAYNLIGNRKLTIDKIKEAQEVQYVTIMKKRDVVPTQLDVFREIIANREDFMKNSYKLLDYLNRAKLTKKSIGMLMKLLDEIKGVDNVPKKKVPTPTKETNVPNVKVKELPKTQAVDVTINTEIVPVVREMNVAKKEPVKTEPKLVQTPVKPEVKVKKPENFIDKVQDKGKSTKKRGKTFFIETVSSKSNMQPTISIYCDGSYGDLGGFYGYAAYDKEGSKIIEKTGFVFDGIFGNSSSGAENMSIIQAIEWAFTNGHKEIEIFYDAYDNIFPFVTSRELTHLQINYKKVLDKFLEHLDVRFHYVEKDQSIHHSRHNEINNLIHEKRI